MEKERSSNTDGFQEIPLDQAYRLINHGPVVLVGTVSRQGGYNIAPIAWNCPVSKSPTRVLLVIGQSHLTFQNITETKRFTVSIPNESQADLVRQTGSVSGKDKDKYQTFGIATVSGLEAAAGVPQGSIGFIECKLVEVIDSPGVGIVIGEAVRAYADVEGFETRVRPEALRGRSLHHLGGGEFALLSGEVNGPAA